MAGLLRILLDLKLFFNATKKLQPLWPQDGNQQPQKAIPNFQGGHFGLSLLNGYRPRVQHKLKQQPKTFIVIDSASNSKRRTRIKNNLSTAGSRKFCAIVLFSPITFWDFFNSFANLTEKQVFLIFLLSQLQVKSRRGLYYKGFNNDDRIVITNLMSCLQ